MQCNATVASIFQRYDVRTVEICMVRPHETKKKGRRWKKRFSSSEAAEQKWLEEIIILVILTIMVKVLQLLESGDLVFPAHWKWLQQLTGTHECQSNTYYLFIYFKKPTNEAENGCWSDNVHFFFFLFFFFFCQKVPKEVVHFSSRQRDSGVSQQVMDEFFISTALPTLP